jgi:hypothetical protein
MTNLHLAATRLNNPDLNEVLTAVNQIMLEVKTNPELNAKFRAEPRKFLGALGFNEDLQRELLQGTGGLGINADICINSCFWTCVISRLGISPEAE